MSIPESTPPGGAPRDAYAGSDFIIIRLSAVRALDGSWEAAGCFQRIAWRCERDGEWRASMTDIAAEIGVSVRTAKRVTTRLRELGWVTADRATAYDPTLTWRVAWRDETGHSGGTESDSRECQVGTHESANGALSVSANLALTSLQTGETTEGLRPSVHDSPTTPSQTPTTAAPRPRARGTRIDPDFAVTDAMKDWYRGSGINGIDPVAETAAFVDHFTATGKAMVDWTAAWRNWLRNAAKRAAPRPGPGRAPVHTTPPNSAHRTRTADYFRTGETP